MRECGCGSEEVRECRLLQAFCRLCAVFLQSQSRIIRVLLACYWRVIGVFLPYFVQYDTYNSKRRIVMYCSNCNATYSTESLFCPLCGQRMSASPCAPTLHNASNQALSSTAPSYIANLSRLLMQALLLRRLLFRNYMQAISLRLRVQSHPPPPLVTKRHPRKPIMHRPHEHTLRRRHPQRQLHLHFLSRHSPHQELTHTPRKAISAPMRSI